MSKRTLLAAVAAAVIATAIGATYAVAGGTGKPGPKGAFTRPAVPKSVFKAPADSECKGRWAVVNADGSIERSCGVTGTEHFDPGIYGVIFNDKIHKCAPQVTVGRNTDDEPYDGVPGYFFSPGGNKKEMGVTVFWQPTTEYYDGDFTLVMTC